MCDTLTVKLTRYGLPWLAATVLLGLSVALAEVDPVKVLFELQQRDVEAYLKVGNLRMYAQKVLSPPVLDELSSERNDNRVVELSGWPARPVEVTCATRTADIRVRDETDYFVIWSHGRAGLLGAGKAEADIVREAVSSILAAPYLIGEAATVVSSTGDAGPGTRIRMLDGPRAIAGIPAVVCSYTNVSEKAARWEFVWRIDILVTETHIVISMEKSKARTAGERHTFEGLLAAKIRLSEEDAEEVSELPIVGENVVVDARADVTECSDALVNGCIWPIESVSTKEICAATILRRGRKPIATSEETADP